MKRFWLFGLIASIIGLTAACGGQQSLVGNARGDPALWRILTKGASFNVYVANAYANRVTVYSEDRQSLLRKIDQGIYKPTGLLFDDTGNLYVSAVHRVQEYAPGQSVPFRTIHRAGQAAPIALDNSSNLYVGNVGVQVYAPGATSPSRTISDGVALPTALLFDSAGNLYVANYAAKDVTVYAPGSDSPSLTVSQGVQDPVAIALDSVGNLYVANQIADTITVYAAGTNILLRTIQDVHIAPSRYVLAFDDSDNLYAVDANSPSGQIRVYKAQSTTILRTITAGVNGPSAVAFDSSGRLYVANTGNYTVTVYNPDKDSVTRTYSKGIKYPLAIAFGP